MATDLEQARNDISKLLDGYVKKRLSKHHALEIVDAVLDNVWKLGYNDAMEDEAIARKQNEW